MAIGQTLVSVIYHSIMIKASNDISIKSFLTDIKIISIIYFVFLISVVCIFGYTPNNDTEGYIEYAKICLHNNQPYPCTATIIGQPFIWNIGIINLVETSIYLFGSIIPILPLMCLMKAITAFLTGKIAEILFNRKVGLTATLLFVLYPGNWGQSTFILSEIPMTCFALLSLYLLLKSNRRYLFFISGFTLCLANWFRGIALIFILAIIIYHLIFDRNNLLKKIVRIFTKCGKPLIAYSISEMTSQEIAELNSFTIKTYPNATFLSNSSATYNCHSYAWNVSDGGKKYWINESSISKYWTDDYYSETTEDNAVKINYYDSDHSAVVSSVKDMYESKWGSCPLMRHAPNYGPYENMEKRKYYKHFYRSDLISCEGTNNGIIKTNIDYTYSIIKDIPTGNYVRYRWSIIDGKEDDATGNDKATLDYNEKNPSAIINIKQPGLYTINCEIYLSTTGEVLGDAMYQPLVEN